MMSAMEVVKCENDLKKLHDLKTTTLQPLIIDAAGSNLRDLSCPPILSERIIELNARSCNLRDVSGLSHLPKLDKLDVGQNLLKGISSDKEDYDLQTLTVLLADNNQIGRGLSFTGFPALIHLDLSNNRIKSLDFVSTIGSQLKVLKISNNGIDNLCELHYLHRLNNLEELEFAGNPCTETLTENKLIIFTKAMIMGKLRDVNGIKINEQQDLQAEILHFNGIRKFKPGVSTHEKILLFINEKLDSMDEKQLEKLTSIRTPIARANFPMSPKNITPSRKLKSIPRFRKRSFSVTPVPVDKIIPASPIQQSIPAPISPDQSKFDQLFTMITSLREDVDSLKAINEVQKQQIDSQDHRILSLETENRELREEITKHSSTLDYLKDQLTIVPANMRVMKRGDKDGYIMKWDNHLKAMYNVENYEFELEDEGLFLVDAPHRRTLLVGPAYGQTVSMQVFHKSDNKASEKKEFKLIPS